MHTVITHIALASAAALVFLLANSALQSKICAVGRYFIGWLLVIGFILPIKIPLFRVEIPESALTALGYEAETDVPLSPPYVFDILADEAQAFPSEREQMPQASAPNGNERVFFPEAVIFALYIIGFFLALSCTLFRYCRAAKVLQRCGRAPKEEEASEYSKLCKKLCVKKNLAFSFAHTMP